MFTFHKLTENYFYILGSDLEPYPGIYDDRCCNQICCNFALNIINMINEELSNFLHVNTSSGEVNSVFLCRKKLELSNTESTALIRNLWRAFMCTLTHQMLLQGKETICCQSFFGGATLRNIFTYKYFLLILLHYY